MGLPWLILLAQPVLSEDSTRHLYTGLTIFAVLVMVLGVVVMVIRKRSQEMQTGNTGPVFTLADLRRLHEDGQLSDEEFERLKQRVIGQTRALGGRGQSSAPLAPALEGQSPRNPLPDSGESGGLRE